MTIDTIHLSNCGNSWCPGEWLLDVKSQQVRLYPAVGEVMTRRNGKHVNNFNNYDTQLFVTQ